MRKVNELLLTSLISFFSLAVSAQEFEIRKGGCMPNVEGNAATATHRAFLPKPNSNWDASRTYRQLVLLMSYAKDNVDFLGDDPKALYNRIFNEPGYTEEGRNGNGCVADYYRDQSNGLCNLQFDIYGPYKVDFKAQPYEKPDSKSKNYQRNAIAAAINMFLADNPGLDFSPYDWDGDGIINQVVIISAGFSGNINFNAVYGYIWPNTSIISPIKTHDNYTISNYTASAELWPNKRLMGIGTICHEFSHSLGLPDLYPVPSSWTYSAVDEWDLMDGGNFTDYGWCPPNYSPLEKMLFGWLDPVELKKPCSITGLKTVSEGGEVYQVKHTDSEYLLLENRQWKGWDLGNPGKGLVVYHVNYDPDLWYNNAVNGSKAGVFNYSIVAADNRDYEAWEKLVSENVCPTYQNGGWMNNSHLSGSSFPYATDSTETVDAFTDTTVPAAVMMNNNGEGSKLLSKPITNIRMSEEGLVSFDFMGGGTPTEVICDLQREIYTDACFDLNGRQVSSVVRHGLYMIRKPNGTIKKLFK